MESASSAPSAGDPAKHCPNYGPDDPTFEKTLCRAAKTIQSAWYTYRDNAFDVLVTKVEHKNGKIYMHEGENWKNPYFGKFPRGLVKNLEDKQAVLTWGTCIDAIAYLHDMIERLFQGLYRDVKEVHFEPKNHKREVRHVAHFGGITDAFDHDVLKVTLINNEVFCVDITGAQHGHYEAVMPWDQYVQELVQEIKSEHSFGYYAGLFKAKSGPFAGVQGGVMQYYSMVTEVFNTIVKDWETQNMTLQELIKLPNDRFRKEEALFISFIDRSLGEYLKQDPLGWNSMAINQPTILNSDLESLKKMFSTVYLV